MRLIATFDDGMIREAIGKIKKKKKAKDAPFPGPRSPVRGSWSHLRCFVPFCESFAARINTRY